MGVNRCGWVCMGAMGCRGTGAHKNKTNRDINGCAGHDLDHIWPGKIPRTSCFVGFAKNGQNGCRWVIMDEYGCDGGYAHGGEQK